MHTLRLYGPLGARFGRVHHFELDTGSPREAMQALAAQVKGLREFLFQSAEKGMAFAVFTGDRNIGEERLDFPTRNEIRVAPVYGARKNGGVLQVVVGAVLIVAGVYLTAISDGTAGEIGGYLVEAGIAMAAGGVIQLLMPQPKGLGSKDSAANTPNYNFNGAVNTEAQGHPVPLCYGGPIRVGSAVASAGVDVVDQSVNRNIAGGSSPKVGFMGGGGGIGLNATISPQAGR